jgi:copper(I)-binding protein
MSRLIRAAAFAAGLALAAGAVQAQEPQHVVKAGALEIVHPWSRATPAGAGNAAAYVTVNNTGTTPDTLLAAAAPTVSDKLEIHEVSMKNGVMSMKRAAGGVAIPAGGSVTLKPGGYHIMIMGVKQPLKQGDSFPGTLTFEKAGKVDVRFTVEAAGATAPSMPMDHGAMDHMHMDH